MNFNLPNPFQVSALFKTQHLQTTDKNKEQNLSSVLVVVLLFYRGFLSTSKVRNVVNAQAVVIHF